MSFQSFLLHKTINKKVNPPPIQTRFEWDLTLSVWHLTAVPAEVQQGACGGRDALSWPAEEVKLSERPGLLRLHVL